MTDRRPLAILKGNDRGRDIGVVPEGHTMVRPADAPVIRAA